MVQGLVQNGVLCLLLLITCSGGQEETCIVKKSTKHSNSTHIRLAHSLLDGYEKELRPVKDWKTSTLVEVDIVVFGIVALDEKEQMMSLYFLYNRYWKDEFLTWDPQEYDDITHISLPTSCVWLPDIIVAEFLDTEPPSRHSYVYINHTGEIRQQTELKMSVMCRIDIYFFPFDRHNCTMIFFSELHTIEDINITMRRRTEDMEKDLVVFYDKGEWELLSVTSSHKAEVEELGNTFGAAVFHIDFRRHPAYYVRNLIIPSAFLMIMDIIGFYLPPESRERVSFKIILLFGYSVFFAIISQSLPTLSQGTPIIEVHFMFCLFLLVISLAESVFIVHIINKKIIQSKVPKWIKKLVLEKMTVWLSMKDKQQYFQYIVNSSDTLQEMETSNNEELLKLSENGENPKISPTMISMKEHHDILQHIFNEMVTLRRYLEKDDYQKTSKEWIIVGYVLDKFLFFVYLVTVLIYIVILSICWSFH